MQRGPALIGAGLAIVPVAKETSVVHPRDIVGRPPMAADMRPRSGPGVTTPRVISILHSASTPRLVREPRRRAGQLLVLD